MPAIRSHAARLLLLAAALPSASSAAEFFGPLPYTSGTVPPGFVIGTILRETFEDGQIHPRLITSGTIIGPGGNTDSVDADDGAVDGNGSNGRSLFGHPRNIEFTPPYPTSAGLVWTDGGPNATVTFEAFGPDGGSLGTIVAPNIGDSSNFGNTDEDRFFGVRDAGGIRSIRLSHTVGGLEVDHVIISLDSGSPPALFGTLEDGDLGLLLPDPIAALPAPAQTRLALPPTAAPHGVAFGFAGNDMLLADFLTPTLHRATIADPATVGSVALTGRTSANGTLATSPDGRYALSVGRANNGSGEAVVVDLGVAPPLVTPIQPVLNVPQFVTDAIDFAPDGRAFVCHSTGVSVLSPPYATVDFTMAFPAIVQSGSQCRLSRDGRRLFVTRVLSESAPSINGVRTTAAPYSADSVFVTMPAPSDVQGLGPMAVSPAGDALLVGQQFVFPQLPMPPRARLYLLRAPFDAQTVYQGIALPPAVSGTNCTDGANPIDCAGFEHIALNDDGTLAILTGNSSSAVANAADKVPAVFVRNPFDDQRRFVVPIDLGTAGDDTLGRGTGAVRFQPARLFRDGLE